MEALETHAADMPAGEPLTCRWWQTIPQAAGGLVFLTLLGWETCRIVSELVQYALLVAAA